MKKTRVALVAALCTFLFPMIAGSVEVSASALSEGIPFHEEQMKPEQAELSNKYGVELRDDVIKTFTISQKEATSGDVVRIDVAFDEEIVESTNNAFIHIIHENDRYSDSQYMVKEDGLNHYINFPITHTMKDGRYYITSFSTDGTLTNDKGFMTDLIIGDDILEGLYFDVIVEKNVTANLTISETQIEENDTATLTMEFSSPNIIAEYVNVSFETERGNTVSHTLKKITETRYESSIKNSEQTEKGKYTLKSVDVFHERFEVEGLKAGFITLNEDGYVMQGENQDFTKPVIHSARISSGLDSTGGDVEIEFELENPDEVTKLKVEMDCFSYTTELSIDATKINEKKYKAVIPQSELAMDDDPSEIDFIFTISAMDASQNFSSWYTNEELHTVRTLQPEADFPEILSIYAENTEYYRGEPETFYVEIKKTATPIKEISIAYMSTDYMLWWYINLDESDIVEEKSDQNKVVFKGRVGISVNAKSTVFIPRYISAITEDGKRCYMENSQMPYSFWQGEFSDYSDGTLVALPERKNSVTQIAGSHRYRTAAEISKLSHDKAETAVLVPGTDFPDALAAGPLAFVLDAPILLTKNNDLPSATKDELNRLGVRNVFILGGNAVINESVVDILKSMDITVERIAGPNRYATAIEAAKLVRRTSGVKEKVIITNADEFADSLSVGSYASRENLPILLTRATALSRTTKTALEDFEVKEVLIMGGEAAVSKAVEEEIRSLGILVKRISGENRYFTAMNAAKEYFSEAEVTIIASGEEFADALAAAPYAAKNNAPIILVRKDRMSATVREYLLSTRMTDYRVIGGDAAVSQQLREAIEDMRD